MRLVHPPLPSAGLIIGIAAATVAIRFLRLRLKSISREIRPSATGGSNMGSSGPSLIVFCCKSPEAEELAQSLKSKWKDRKLFADELNETKVLLHSEMDSTVQLNFQPHLYMKALSTSEFGKFLLWSPRLPSTHDVVSQ